jgi:hypothetical protein
MNLNFFNRNQIPSSELRHPSGWWPQFYEQRLDLVALPPTTSFPTAPELLPPEHGRRRSICGALFLVWGWNGREATKVAFIDWWTGVVAQRTENGDRVEGRAPVGHEVGNNIAMVRSLC